MSAIAALDGFDLLDALCDAASQMRAQQPWLGEVVLPVRGLILSRDAGGWSLIDRESRALPAVLPEAAGWTLLAVSGGSPVDLSAGFDGSRLRPLAVLAGGEFRSLIAAGEDAL